METKQEKIARLKREIEEIKQEVVKIEEQKNQIIVDYLIKSIAKWD